MRCHYEVLNIDRSADDKEIKLAYRKQALVWHPDKNPNNQEEAEVKFKEISEAYNVLSDPHERSWYDNHRESILHGKDDTQGEDQTAINLWQYFTDSCYNGFSKEIENNFYKVYADLFEEIDQRENNETNEEELREYFGNESSSIDDITRFYGCWEAFSSKRSFGWVDKYKLSEAPTRKVKRLMEKENKKLREKERKKFNQTLRELVSFVKKRDPRWIEYLEKEKKEKEKKQEKVKKQKEILMKEKKKKMDEIQSLYEKEMESFDLEEHGIYIDEENDNLIKKEELYCLVCNKNFRSKNQWKNHEKSKKHLDALEIMRESVMLDSEIIDSGINSNNSVSLEDDELSLNSNEELSDDILDDNIIPLQDESNDYEEEEEEEEEIIIMSSFRNKKNKKKQKKQQKRKAFIQSNLENTNNEEKEELKTEHEVINNIENEDEIGKEDNNNNNNNNNDNDNNNNTDTNDNNNINNDIVNKQTKKKRRRAKKGKNTQNITPQSNISAPASNTNPLICATCKTKFPSRNKLFKHVKKTNHAKPL